MKKKSSCTLLEKCPQLNYTEAKIHKLDNFGSELHLILWNTLSLEKTWKNIYFASLVYSTSSLIQTEIYICGLFYSLLRTVDRCFFSFGLFFYYGFLGYFLVILRNPKRMPNIFVQVLFNLFVKMFYGFLFIPKKKIRISIEFTTGHFRHFIGSLKDFFCLDGPLTIWNFYRKKNRVCVWKNWIDWELSRFFSCTACLLCRDWNSIFLLIVWKILLKLAKTMT